MYQNMAVVLVSLAGLLAGCQILRDVPEDEFRALVEQMPITPAPDNLRAKLGGKMNGLCVGKVIPYDTSGLVRRAEAGESIEYPTDFRWISYHPVGKGENELFRNSVVVPRVETLLSSLQVGKVILTCTPESIRVDVRIGTVFKKTVPQQLLTHLSLDFWYGGMMFMDVGRDWDTTYQARFGPRELKGVIGPKQLEEVLEREFQRLLIEAQIKWRRIFGPDPPKKQTTAAN